MTNLKLLSVVAILSAVIATPVFAQAAIDEPGAFAFYHPNADVLNGGRPTPAATTDAMASAGRGSYKALRPRSQDVTGPRLDRSQLAPPVLQISYDCTRHHADKPDPIYEKGGLHSPLKATASRA